MFLLSICKRFPVFKCCSVDLKAYTKDQLKIKTVQKRAQLNFKPSAATSVRSALPVTVENYVNSSIANTTFTDASPSQIVSNEQLAIEKKPREISSYSNRTEISPNVRTIANLSKLYNDFDSTASPLTSSCSGCGASLHCTTPGEPGFISLSDYNTVRFKDRTADHVTILHRDKYAKSSSPIICVRCSVMQEHFKALHTSFDSNVYKDVVSGHLQQQKNATIILLSDVVNLPHSLIPNVKNLLGPHRYILVGNKVDQLPIDGVNYVQRWTKVLLKAALDRCGLEQTDVLHTFFISALTGYGVTRLLDFLLSRRFDYASPLYIVGTTNVGKSSLFNRLLLSDLCKAEAKEAIHRATISDWPGTTAGLLKFPMVRMNAFKRELRKDIGNRQPNDKKATYYEPSCAVRLLKPQQVRNSDHELVNPLTVAVDKTREKSSNLLDMTTYTWSHDNSQSSKVESNEVGLNEMYRKYLSKNIAWDRSTWDGDRGDRLLTTLLDPRRFNEQSWCFDTPGFVCLDQTLNYLSSAQLAEISKLKSFSSMPRARMHKSLGTKGTVLVPRIFVLRPNLCILLGKLGRLDLLHAPGPVYCTTFTTLPVHIVEQSEVDDYVANYSKELGLQRTMSSGPCGSLPPMAHLDLEPFEAQSKLDGSMFDVVLSGAGWISVAGLHGVSPRAIDQMESNSVPVDGRIHMRAWTPAGLGISLRSPALLPGFINRRIRRLFLMREFSIGV